MKLLKFPNTVLTEDYCILYNTKIVERVDGGILLNTGGWNTPTTFRRMNQVLKLWGYCDRVSLGDFKERNELWLSLS